MSRILHALFALAAMSCAVRAEGRLVLLCDEDDNGRPYKVLVTIDPTTNYVREEAEWYTVEVRDGVFGPAITRGSSLYPGWKPGHQIVRITDDAITFGTKELGVMTIDRRMATITYPDGWIGQCSARSAQKQF